MKTIQFIFFSAFTFLLATSLAQNSELFNTGVRLRNEHHSQEALSIFQKLLGGDSNNVNYLSNASYLYTKVGNLQTLESYKKRYYNTAEYLARKALQKDDKNAENHYDYAFALGRLNEYGSSKQKIAVAKVMKIELDKAIQLNPKHAGAYHILGRWNRTIAEFSSIERLAINVLFGGVPEGGSLTDAVNCFTKAIQYEPDYVLHYYELAVTYHSMDKNDLAKTALENGLKVTADNEDNREAIPKCKTLLNELSK